MVCFDVGPTRFNFRTAAFFEDDGWVLLCQSQSASTFWFLPGGRVDMMEATPDTLRREMAEELGAEVEVGPLQWVAENFFIMDGRRFHEIGFYYRASFKDPAYLDKGRTWHGVVDGPFRLNFRWFRLDELDRITVRPPFLAEALRNPPTGVGHIVHIHD